VQLPGQAAGAAPSHSGREYWRGVARIGVQVGDALAYAHAQGVLHRDVKPSNLLLDAGGNVWVTDFGLAKSADDDDLTGTGHPVGTLRYMAPECFSGNGDKRADVYSLGLTLYELLTLRPAFSGKDGKQLLAEVMHGEPPRPRSVHRDVPRDLETVVLKAIARDPSHRYATAAELADDLRLFVDDRPVRARRVSAAELLWRWGRRNPAVASLTAAVLLLLVAGAVGSAVAAYHFSRARDDADAARKEAQDTADQLSDELARLNRANALMESGQLHADAGQFDKALADYSAAIEQRPDVSVVWFTRGQLYMQLYCWDEAAADFDRGFGLQPPADPQLWLSHAVLRVYVGDRDGYRRTCTAMLERFGQTTEEEAAVALATACTAGPDALNDFSRVIQLVEKAKSQPPHQWRLGMLSPVGIAALQYRAGNAEQALRAPVMYGRDAQIFEAMAQHRLGFGNARNALDDVDIGLDSQLAHQLADALEPLFSGSGLPPPANHGVNETWGFWDRSGRDRAALSSNHLVTYVTRREAHMLLADPAHAEHPLYWILRARGLVALGRWDDARSFCNKAIALIPDNVTLLYARGKSYAMQMRWDEAAADFAKVREMMSDAREEKDAHLLEGPSLCVEDMYEKLTKWDRLLDRLLKLRPNDAELYEIRARRDWASDEWDQKVRDYSEALRCRGRRGCVERGELYAEHGRWKEAVADFCRWQEVADDHLGPGSSGWEYLVQGGEGLDAAEEYACLLLLSGDQEGYRKACASLAERFANGKETKPRGYLQLSRLASLTPDAVPDPTLLVRWAETGRNANISGDFAENLQTMGLAHYRAGHFEEAVRWCRDSLKESHEDAPGRQLNCLVLALAHHRLQHLEEARKWLDKATDWLDEVNARRPKEEAEFLPPDETYVSRWMEYLILRREAEALLGDKKK
jgi:tetratricopeptide (TPR) repeat protein